MDVIPQDLNTIFEAEAYNGFGFYAIGDGRLQLGLLNENIPDDFDQRLKDLSRSETVHIVQWLGRNFLVCQWTEFDKIPDIYNAVLQLNEPFCMTNSLKVCFKPDERFSWALMEHKAIRTFEKCYNDWKREDRLVNGVDHNAVKLCTTWNWALEWNWHTEEGRAFSRRLVDFYGMPREQDTPRFHWKDYDKKCRENNLYHRSAWCAYEPSCGYGEEAREEKELERKEADNVIDADMENDANEDIDEEINEEVMCMLCEENPPDTIVLPCEHRVVCRACSEKLSATGYTKKCVACTREITMVLADNAAPVLK